MTESIVTIVVVVALAAGAVWFYLRAQELRPDPQETHTDEWGPIPLDRVWVNWDDPEVWVQYAETEAEKARRWEEASVRIELEEDV